MGEHFSHLTEEEARAILRDVNACPHCGERPSLKRLALRHGTSTSTIVKVVSGAHRFSNCEPLPDCDGEQGVEDR